MYQQSVVEEQLRKFNPTAATRYAVAVKETKEFMPTNVCGTSRFWVSAEIALLKLWKYTGFFQFMSEEVIDNRIKMIDNTPEQLVGIDS